MREVFSLESKLQHPHLALALIVRTQINKKGEVFDPASLKF
jgi:hypothetical protein